MSKDKMKKKVVAEPDVKSELAAKKPAPVVPNDQQKSDFQNHPKFDKFKNPQDGE